jgi:sugar phosphate permease
MAPALPLLALVTNLPQRLSRVTPFYYGWVIVVVAGLANASRVASAVEVSSVFLPALSAEYGWDRTVVASATTLGGVATALASPWVGRVLDRYGGRIVVPAGAFLVGVGCLTLAGVESAGLFVFVYAFVRMSGQSMVQFPNQVTVAKWFERRRGAAVSLLVGIGATGLIAAPFGVQFIIERFSIGAAWAALGILALSLGVVPSLLFSTRRPEDLGLLPDGADTPAGGDVDDGASAATDGSDWTLREAAVTPAFWLLAISSVMFSMSSTGVGFFQFTYYLEQGIDASLASGAVSMFAFGLFAGGVFWGWLADRVSVRFLIMLQYAIAASIMLYLLRVDTAMEAYPFGFAMGSLVGGAMSLPTLLLASYFGRRSLGAIAGVFQMSRGLSLGSGPLVASLLRDVTGSFETAFIVFSVLCTIAVFMMVAARNPSRGFTENRPSGRFSL